MNDKDFIHSYQSALFKESNSDNYTSANLKRNLMCMAFNFSSERHCNQTTCNILEDYLKSYIDLIDDRKGINNFAQATQELTANIKNDCKLWKSNLSKDGPKIEDLLKPLSGDCSNETSDGLCSALIPSVEEIKALESSYETVNFTTDEDHGNKYKGSNIRNYFPKEDPRINNNSQPPSQKETINPRRDTFVKTAPITTRVQHSTSKYKNAHTSSSNSYVDIENNSEVVYPTGSGFFSQRIGKSTLPKRSGGSGAIKQKNKDEFSFENEDNDIRSIEMVFKTAGQQLEIDNKKKFGNFNNTRSDNSSASGYHPTNVLKKSLGGKRSVSTKFVPPIKTNSQEERYGSSGCNYNDNSQPLEEVDERLKNIEPRMIELIKSEIMDSGAKVEWDDIAGLDFAKSTIQEIVVWPMLRPDIFTGLRSPPKGILLFGPPGTGKTLIGKCIASQSNATFFSISASSLTSKWIGDGEKMVRALFAVARVHQPAVVFIDEIDSLLSQRSDTEHESSRRLKTEFLVQLDGAATGEEERILVIGATNRPQELDEAARRRLVKRLYIPLPDFNAREQLVTNLMKLEKNILSKEEINEVAQFTDGYSGADIKNLCKEACLGPIRSIATTQMFQIKADQVRPVNIDDFKIAISRVRPSVSPGDIQQYLVWNRQYGFSSSSI